MDMSTQIDFKKEWEKTKKQLQKFSKEASVIARKGEKELVHFSKLGKLHVDSTAINLKLERLYYLIGKEYVKLKTSTPNAKMKKLIEEYKVLIKEHKALQAKISKESK